jgi:hypothetical protein
MDTAILSDLHLGAWQLNDLLRYPRFIKRLTRALGDVDQVVLLGDVLDLRFQRLDEALRVAAPFFRALGDTLRARRARGRTPRVVYVAGNHDNHFATRLIEAEQERALLLGRDGYRFSGRIEAPTDMFLVRALGALLGTGIEVRFEYAYLTLPSGAGPVLATHGHYLDLHLSSPGERLLALLQQALTAYGQLPLRPSFDLYEAILRPQNEVLHWIGQSPAGGQVESVIYRRMRGNRRAVPRGLLGRLRRNATRRGLRVGEALAGAVVSQLTRRLLKGDVAAISPAQASEVDEAIRAFMDSLYALEDDLFGAEGWTSPPAYAVFGHTHRPGPLAGVDMPALWRPRWGGQMVQILNCGSWVYDFPNALTPEYRQTRWPGTFVLVPEDDEPRLVAVLKDLSADDVEEIIDREAPQAEPMPSAG